MISSGAWAIIQTLRDGPSMGTPVVSSTVLFLLSGAVLIIVSGALRFGRKNPHRKDL